MKKPKKQKDNTVGKLTMVKLKELVLPTNPMRAHAESTGIGELARSMNSVGLIQPITVVRKGEGYEVVAGDRRTRAARTLKWDAIPAFVIPEAAETHQVIMYAENLERRDISVVEEALFYQQLVRSGKWTQRRIAKDLGRSEADVSEKLKLLTMPEQVVEAVETGKLSYASSREIGRIKDQKTRDAYFEHAIRSGINDETARQWRESANVEIARGEAPKEEPDPEAGANVAQVIRCQCDECRKTVDITNTIAVRLCTSCVRERVTKVGGK
jgi:ParB family chromosome partitioning protein